MSPGITMIIEEVSLDEIMDEPEKSDGACFNKELERAKVEMARAKIDALKAHTMLNSAEVERVTKNVMRHEYRKLDEDEKQAMQEIKDVGLELHEYLTSLGNSRELSLAKTKIEEAVMWAVKHITK